MICKTTSWLKVSDKVYNAIIVGEGVKGILPRVILRAPKLNVLVENPYPKWGVEH